MRSNLVAALRLIGIGILGVTGFTLRAHACSTPVTDVRAGVLAGWPQGLPEIPRNVAFVVWRPERGGGTSANPVQVAVDSTSQPVMARVMRPIDNRPGTFIAKPDEPLSAHLEIDASNEQFTTGDFSDEAPPEVPRIIEGSVQHDDRDGGCGGAVSSCAGLTSLIVTLGQPAKDDRAPKGGVAYAIYLAKSADVARTMPNPFALVSDVGAVDSTSLVLTLEPSWADVDAFVSISAMDWAANESPRTEPLQVNSGGSGCTVGWPRRHRPTFAIALAILSGLAWARRAKRRGSPS